MRQSCCTNRVIFSGGASHFKRKSMRLYFLVGFSSYSQYFDEYVTISTLFIVIERPSIFFMKP